MPTSREIIVRPEAGGWVHVRTKGSHHHFKHPERPYLITVVHPRRDNPAGYVRQLEKLSGLTF